MTNLSHYHFIGVGGIGMSGLAELLVRRGHRVSGSDLAAGPLSRRLETLGLRSHEGQPRPRHFARPGAVVVPLHRREGEPIRAGHEPATLTVFRWGRCCAQLHEGGMLQVAAAGPTQGLGSRRGGRRLKSCGLDLHRDDEGPVGPPRFIPSSARGSCWPRPTKAAAPFARLPQITVVTNSTDAPRLLSGPGPICRPSPPCPKLPLRPGSWPQPWSPTLAPLLRPVSSRPSPLTACRGSRSFQAPTLTPRSGLPFAACGVESANSAEPQCPWRGTAASSTPSPPCHRP